MRVHVGAHSTLLQRLALGLLACFLLADPVASAKEFEGRGGSVTCPRDYFEVGCKGTGDMTKDGRIVQKESPQTTEFDCTEEPDGKLCKWSQCVDECKCMEGKGDCKLVGGSTQDTSPAAPFTHSSSGGTLIIACAAATAAWGTIL
uniref:Pacifastin domain-containing protein n=1 Tax=Odontella aurita TaxID=265563 RepID=A0A7S4JL96_9STRA|mmetsp:Transcript_48529/g.146388  ORF Transcript_48529/g.146388 Transcript_48529/m.146388 type:complete len:146 (+) Transcript_48529:556-993(+)|eukprot:CAMPEP_0113533834 /NCGR_PEP_ID=MMETSP0015_2-20120614/4832_1 /TAXON_ID=2838 /ORGANISM="Odontella" /LENGTH=145 /DNA_ID=CAMNT_0000432945 /DNA_START=512 /DNA_END=949 /DNA_ORIENTATION=+ /assembly_acc=CAM_ASM_000160